MKNDLDICNANLLVFFLYLIFLTEFHYFMVLLSQPPKFWDYRCVATCVAFRVSQDLNLGLLCGPSLLSNSVQRMLPWLGHRL